MKTIKGDLVELAKNGKFDAIIHGCNCFNTMGAGIAKTIKQEFPNAYKIDKFTEYGDSSKLGTITSAFIKEYDLIVINAYTQYHYKTKKNSKPIDYDALRNAFKNIKEFFGDKEMKFGIPQIGCGLAGGDWNVVSKIIDEEMKNENLIYVEYDG